MSGAAAQLRSLLTRPEPVIAPGAFSPLVARLVAEAGFPAVYLSGAGVAGGIYGQPDVGLVTLTELADVARRTAEAIDIPIICDADTGYGGVLNVRRTVRELEAAGVAGLHIEDQDFPRRCGFLEVEKLVSVAEMVARIKAALDARRDPDLLIIARTELFGAASLNETIERAGRYHEAGADMIFCNGVVREADVERLSAEIAAPQLYNVSTSGRTPHLGRDRLSELGYRIVIYPAHSLFLAVKQIRGMLATLRDEGTITPWLDRMIDFDDWKRLTGIDEMEQLERSYEP